MKTEVRDEQFCNVVLSFVKAKVIFDELLEEYRDTGKVAFPKLDDFVENILFALKENSHFLFRKPDQSDGIGEEGLFDISVGSIFHELMKIKENVYQLEYYAPMYTTISKTERQDAPRYERAFLDAFHKIVRRARRSLQSDLASAEELFRDAANNLKMMLRAHITNPLLPRVIIEHQNVMNRCFRMENVDQLLSEIYADKLDEAHLIASRDYLEGGWYDKAGREAKRVLELDPENIEARQIIKKLAGKAAAV